MLAALAWAFAAVPDALGLGIAAMGFDAQAFQRVAQTGGGRDLALLMVYFAGISQGIGHGVVLFLNRVRPARFVLSLALMGAIYLASALVTALATMLASDLAFRMGAGFWPTIGVVALAQAPRLLGALTLAPYLGEWLDRLLEVWVLTLTLFGLHVGLGLPVEGAALAALLGWVAVRLLWLLFGRPVTVLLDTLRHAAAGAPLTLNARNLVETLKERAEAGGEPRDGER
jgi:hypothetical protein